MPYVRVTVIPVFPLVFMSDAADRRFANHAARRLRVEKGTHVADSC